MPVKISHRGCRVASALWSGACTAASGGWAAISARVAEEDGFTMLLTLFTLVITSVLVAAALAAAGDDVGLVRTDLDQKKAYYAAQAGISDYAYHLNEDVNYWTYCTNVPTPNAVNQWGSTANRRYVAGVTDERYAIELLPATGYSSCNPSSPVASMIEGGNGPAAGTFRIRSTGYSGNVQRSIVATFRRVSFVDYVYYTVYETLDPSAYSSASDRTAAATACDIYWRNGRQPPISGRNYCVQIFFTSGDQVNGPLHTEDLLATCGTPVFGRGTQDRIEVVDPAGWSHEGNSCTGTPSFQGKPVFGATSVLAPPTNAQLKLIANPTYQFTGQTHITLKAGPGGADTMSVYNNGTTQVLPFPSNGVVYVSSGACSTTYSPFNVTYSTAGGFPYSGGTGCGNVTVDTSGTLTQSLTIGSDNDILIDGNVLSNGLLGLIAQNFVRVYHPCSSNTNLTGTMQNVTIDAAILSVTGSFIVDNYNCGAQLGQLNVFGAIAQEFRGPVGVINTNGYLKNYNYNDNLREEEPPHFLNPVQAAWRIQRETECSRGVVPPTGTPGACP